MLVTCSECGQKVSNKAKACPHCGAPIGEGGEVVEVSSLKRSVALVFAIFLGWLGAHNAYLGFKKRQYLDLFIALVGLVTLPFGIGVFILGIQWIWSVIAVLSCRTDSDGKILNW